ncbi:InlB B-repeat-containing protein, partial [Peptoniphilus catoniae]|uniref:InlB B-repeat-containing protein n=1 Tax=Peptoniphilus catoniae TaxID=1660341 RepID=UPI0015D62256
MKKKRGRRIAMLLAMMMLIMNLIVSPVWAGPGDVEINATNFPDGKFRAYVVTLDVDGDGKLSDTEIAGITAINVRNENIADLTGIKYFTALQTLTCSYNKLSTLDISKNPALKELYCNNNILTTLDLSNNPALRELDCTKNNLTNLDVSNNPALVNLSCDKNKLTNLDVSNNPALVNLSCDENKLTHLDMSNSPALVSLHCYYNEISTLDVSNNPALKYLTCFGNPLTNLDLSNNSALVKLTCYACGLTNLDVSNSPALEYLQCYANQLTNLDLSNNPALEYLHCGSSQLTNLDLSKNTALKSLYCDENELTNLDLSKNTALKSLGCSGNELTKLDVSKNTALRYLHCYSNHLTSLNLVNNTEINDFHGGYQTYDVKVKTSDLKINYADFPDNFESAQVLNLIGATLEADGFKVDNAKPTQVTYDYATGLDSEELNVTLNITYVCTVTFNTNGGTAINPQTITAGGHVTKPTDPTKDGYTFAGWYKDAGLTTPFDFVNETINTDITLYAKWTQNAPTSYTVTFNTNGGSAVASQTITAGGHVTKPTDPTKDGYTFAGWYKDAEFTTPFDFVNETINTDTTIYAKWTEKTPPAPVTYTLTASVEGGHGSVTPTNATKNKNETVTLTFTPETGYELDTVTVNGTAVGVMGNVLDVTMNENKTV